MIDYPTLYLQKKHDYRIKAGHQWIFSNELKEVPRLDPGTVVDFVDAHGLFLARGYYNPHSLICGRVLTHNSQEAIDRDFFSKRLNRAFEYRKFLYPGEESYRLVFSEADFLPGIIIDKYMDHLVFQVLTAGMELWKSTLVELASELFKPACIYERSDSANRAHEDLEKVQQCLSGTPDPNLCILQDGVRLKVNLQEGQKTGFFFDHRENRKSLASIVPGKEVLDLFCGTAPWTLYCTQYGATNVLGVDSSALAIDLAKENAHLNKMESRCEFLVKDVFDALLELNKNRKKYDVVLCDPPAFAKSRTHRNSAIKGYLRLNQLALSLVKPGGYLVSSSCSQLVSRSEFRDILKESGFKSDKNLILTREGGQGPDHPILMQVPETEYLKCLTVKVENR